MRIIRIVFFLGLFAAIGLGYYAYTEINNQFSVENNEINIPKGYGFSQINGLLARNGIIKNPRIFYHYAKWTGSLNQLQAGFYKFPSQTTHKEILEILKDGSKHFIKVTLPEGKNLYEVAHILERAEVIPSAARFIRQSLKKPDPSFGLPADALSFEGYLYPETYYFSPKSSIREVIYKMVLTFNEKTNELPRIANGLNWHQMITLASIVEKETGVASERPRIAGVFFNRLNRKMRLQSDPTTIYGIYERFDGNLRKKDLLEETAYNTYKIKSLPPGPIANPGLKAIQAIVNPERHKYLYFVSKNDGTHTFSKSYKEHQQAVDYFQKKIRRK